jgi:hypothetical protein
MQAFSAIGKTVAEIVALVIEDSRRRVAQSAAISGPLLAGVRNRGSGARAGLTVREQEGGGSQLSAAAADPSRKRNRV